MKKILFLTICSFTFLQVKAQYTQPTGSNSGYQNIIEVIFQGIDNPSPYLSTPADFYSNYTSLSNSISTSPGSSFHLQIKTYNEANLDKDELYVWIDWNQDGVFDPTTEKVYSTTHTSSSAGQQTTFSTDIAVPTSVPDWVGSTGEYRMRIAFNYTGFGTPTAPSGTGYTDAEFEDYDVNIPVMLPVKLTSFTASTEQHQIDLQWQTATELNNAGFEIDRSLVNDDADFDKSASYNWTKVGYINGAGNSSITQNYAFTDKDVPAGEYLYRLKQVDYDGHYAYSDVVEAAILPEGFYLEQNYPNPVHFNATIRYQLAKKADINLLLFNQQGKLIKKLVDKTQQAGSYSIDLNTANLPDGIYYYRLSAGGQEQSRKLIVIK